MEMTPQRHVTAASRPSRWNRGLAFATCLVLLGLCGAAPARATTTVINSTWTGPVPITINVGDEVDIMGGGSVTNTVDAAIVVNGGTLSISGGSVTSPTLAAISMDSGTLNITGGTVSGGGYGVAANVASISISGGSVTCTGTYGAGVRAYGGALTISGGSVSGPGFQSAGVQEAHLDGGPSGGTATITGGNISGFYGISGDAGTITSISGDAIVSGSDTGVISSGSVNMAGGSISGHYVGVASAGGPLTLTGGSVNADLTGLNVESGTATVSGGTISVGLTSSSGPAIYVSGGVMTMSGGSISGNYAILVNGGAATLSGGLVSTTVYGLQVGALGPTLTVKGCNLALTGGGLTGVLQDGSPISSPFSAPSLAQIILEDPCFSQQYNTLGGALGAITVTASPLWTNTGITLSPQNHLVVHGATGLWNWAHVSPDFGPDGDYQPQLAYDEWISDSQHGQLIGFVGDSPFNHGQNDPAFFVIGSGSVNLNDKSGELWLGFNDDFYTHGTGDNSGSVTVRVDGETTPPTTTATPSSAPNANGWYAQNVTVALSAVASTGGSGVKQISYSLSGAQNGSAVVPGSSASVTISAEGMTTLTYFATDNAGNQESPHTLTVNIDKTPPVVAYAGNAGIYAVDQMVNITCAATDALSGVASSTCRNITGPAYSFSLGTNSFSASATDKAGNTGSSSTSFTVQDTPGALTNLVTQLVTDPAVVQGLTDKLNAVAADIAGGNAHAKAGMVGAFINQVNAQTGKSITQAQAAILIQLVSAL